jgi:hypothetical protein|tara:strand:- start:24 stop:224 length:201 start_codon:yes stop_codon:yes gene_type:complete
MKYPFYIRITILFCVAAFSPILIHYFIMWRFDVSIQRAAEITFILCIPIAVWLATKINERWHDDRE